MNVIKLRLDTFNFLRKNPVELSRYLPRWLYADETFSKIQGALNEEHEKYRLQLIENAKQFYVQTADSEGLKDWERLLKITTKKEAATNLRRSLVTVKRRGGEVLTIENTKKLMREFLRFQSTETEVGIEELGENKLKLIVNNGDFHWEELLQALWDMLPAHLIFNFDIIEDLGEETVHYAQATADATLENFGLDMLSPPPETITIGIYPVDISAERFGLDSSDEHTEHGDYLKYAIIGQESELTEIDCDRSEILDEETVEDFERYLRRRWSQFKNNPVVKYYRHGTHGEEEGEIEPDEEEIFPVEVDFLRLYFNFPDSESIRYLTVLQPRPDVSGNEINALSLVSKNMLLSRNGLLSDRIIKSVYVEKSTLKVL